MRWKLGQGDALTQLKGIVKFAALHVEAWHAEGFQHGLKLLRCTEDRILGTKLGSSTL